MKCYQCKQNFPDDFGGNLCPKCDDLMYEARLEMNEDIKHNGDD